MKTLITIALFSTIALSTLGQGKKFLESKEIGLIGGTSYYIGDINQTRHFGGNLSIAGGVMFRNNIDKRWSVKAQFLVGRFAASDADSDDAWQQNRNLSFRNDIIEAAVQAELNFLPYQIGNKDDRWTPYLFLGAAFYTHRPQAEFNGQWFDLAPLGTEGQGTTEGGEVYNENGIAFPFGAGFKANLFSIVAVSLEWGMRKTYTDYLDDVSGVYVSPTVLAEENGVLSATLADRSLAQEGQFGDNTGQQRGDSGRNDWYSFTTLTLSFRIGKKPTTCWNPIRR
ncbi:MAG: hypothetical protein HRT74_14040 [Flavobacteriales bacterium]|nr:hypothetical protein [Flavobacteriales bacterium]